MKVAKWGNSLAVRLPQRVVRDLALKEGDELELRPVGPCSVEVLPDRRREEAFIRMEALSRPLPPDYVFDRDEIYDRAGSGSPGRIRGDG